MLRALGYSNAGAQSGNRLLAGLVTDIRFQDTTGAFFLGYCIVVSEDDVETISGESQKMSLDYMKGVFSARIATVEKLLRGFG
jgi:hypothetical protein